MDTSTALKIAKTMHALSLRLEIPTDDVHTIIKGFLKPKTDSLSVLNIQLATLIREMKNQSLHAQDAFQKTTLSMLRYAQFFLAQRKIKQIRTSIPTSLKKQDSLNNIREILKLSELQCPVPFWFAAPELLKDTVKKISEGGFAEVFEIIKDNGEKRIVKLIPIKGRYVFGKYPEHLTIKETATEIHAALCLSKLRFCESRCSHYPLIHKISIVQDKMPETVVNTWKSYKIANGAAHPCPDVFPSDQIYLLIESENAGIELGSYKNLEWVEALSVFLQVSAGLAVAEECLQFEHRDLHENNILIKNCPQKKLEIRLGGRQYTIESYGLKATIIDFTYSRIKTENKVHFLNMNALEIQKPKEDKTFLNNMYVYEKMSELTKGNWSKHHPKTNVLWLKHIAENLIHKGRDFKKNPTSILNSMAKVSLNIYSRTCLTYDSAAEFVRNEFDSAVSL